MKKLMISIIVVVCLLGMVSMAYANSGKAIVPEIMAQNGGGASYYTTVLNMSNITENPATVKIIIYKKDGSILVDDGNQHSGLIWIGNTENLADYSDNLTDGSTTFTLEANSTTQIYIKGNRGINYGYGIIEWTQDSKAAIALVAHGQVYYANSQSFFAVPINNGQPF